MNSINFLHLAVVVVERALPETVDFIEFYVKHVPSTLVEDSTIDRGALSGMEVVRQMWTKPSGNHFVCDLQVSQHLSKKCWLEVLWCKRHLIGV